MNAIDVTNVTVPEDKRVLKNISCGTQMNLYYKNEICGWGIVMLNPVKEQEKVIKIAVRNNKMPSYVMKNLTETALAHKFWRVEKK